MHRIPFLIPHILQRLFQPRGPQPQTYGVRARWLQRQRPEAAAEMWLAAPSRLALLAKPLSCPPFTQRLTPAQAGGTTGTYAGPPEDAPPSPMPRSVLLINQRSQLRTAPTSVPWSCLVSALEGHIRTGTNGLHGYPCMCFPFWRTLSHISCLQM